MPLSHCPPNRFSKGAAQRFADIFSFLRPMPSSSQALPSPPAWGLLRCTCRQIGWRISQNNGNGAIAQAEQISGNMAHVAIGQLPELAGAVLGNLSHPSRVGSFCRPRMAAVICPLKLKQPHASLKQAMVRRTNTFGTHLDTGPFQEGSQNLSWDWARPRGLVP